MTRFRSPGLPHPLVVAIRSVSPGQMAFDPSRFQNSLVLSVLTEPPCRGSRSAKRRCAVEIPKSAACVVPFPAWCKFDNKTPCHPTKGGCPAEGARSGQGQIVFELHAVLDPPEIAALAGGLSPKTRPKPANEPPNFRCTCMVSAPQPVKNQPKASLAQSRTAP